MLDIVEAEALIREHVSPLDPVRCALSAAGGAVLREEISADRDQPPMDRVMMDGIAVRHRSWLEGQRAFAVAGVQAAGHAPSSLDDPLSCIEVMTGSCLPTGSDCVIPVERIRRQQDRALLEDGYRPEAGQFIHPRGSDYSAGDTLLRIGTLLRSPEISVLAANGRDTVLVSRRPRVSVISTGDELVPPGQPLASHQIHSSNDSAMAAALDHLAERPVRTINVPDDPARLVHDIARELKCSDVLVLSGGVSMGKFDFLPRVFREIGVTEIFHKIRQRPGKPMWFGLGPDGQPVFALPGNPVSALTCLHRYVLPAIRNAMAMRQPPPRRAALASSFEFAPDLACFLPVRIRYDSKGTVSAEPRPTNTSGDFSGLTETDGFLELIRTRQHFPAGWTAEFYPWL